MGRNIRRHPHGNTAGPIDQHIGKARGQNSGLAIFAIVIVLKIHCVFVDICKHIGRRVVHTHFGVPHRGRIVAIHRAKVALSVKQGKRHGKILRHTHQGIIDGAVPMRVIFPHHFAHRTGRFSIGLVMGIAGFMHGIKDAPMHWLQSIPQIRDRAAHNNTHCIVKVRRAKLIRYRNGWPFMG